MKDDIEECGGRAGKRLLVKADVAAALELAR
jgi:hypothetical protein